MKPCHYDGRMDVRPHKAGATRWLRRLALVLWLASLVLPTLPTPDIGSLPGTPLRGAYLLAKSVVMALYLPHSIGYPLHLLSLASNVVFVRELLALVPRWRHRFGLWSPWRRSARRWPGSVSADQPRPRATFSPMLTRFATVGAVFSRFAASPSVAMGAGPAMST